jgi:CRP-like cAMP-binding protein
MAMAAGFRQVISGERQEFRHEYVCHEPSGYYAFTLTIARIASDGAVHALIARENSREHKRADTSRGFGSAEARRVAPAAREGTPNRLLSALPDDEYERLFAGFEPVKLTYGEVLYEPGEPIRYVYFPNDCPVSLLTVVEGRSLEVGLIGPEGLVGSGLALGGTTSACRALVQGSGTAVRMKSRDFLQELQRSPALQLALLCSIDSLLIQVTQNAACNRFHVIVERLARWLLMTRERSPSPKFCLTQDFLSKMLGTRRESVTEAANVLKLRNLIDYSRGNITILDQRGLEAASCSCYRRVKVA